ncbi:MAG: c-type cytochrome [Leptospirillia bacterium]
MTPKEEARFTKGRRNGRSGFFGGLVVALAVVESGTGAAWGDVQAGSVLYKNNCIACHGVAGNGKGPAASGIHPAPPDFTDPAFWKTVTDSYLLHVITNGLGPMPGWGGTLSPLDIDNLLDYIKTFRKK